VTAGAGQRPLIDQPQPLNGMARPPSRGHSAGGAGGAGAEDGEPVSTGGAAHDRTLEPDEPNPATEQPRPAAPGPEGTRGINAADTARTSSDDHAGTTAPADGADLPHSQVDTGTPKTFLPMSEDFRRPYEAIDNFTYHIDQHAPPAVREQFNTEMRPRIREFQTDIMGRFKATYKKVFPSTSTERELNPEQSSRARALVRPLVTETQNMLSQVRDWAHATGHPDIAGNAFDTAVTRGRQVWQQRYQQHKDAIDDVVGRYSYKGRPIGYVGSMKNGIRGPHKANTQTDLNGFDVDLYVVDPEEFNRIRGELAQHGLGEKVRDKIFLNPKTKPFMPELNKLSRNLVDELKALFPGNEDVGESSIVVRQDPTY